MAINVHNLRVYNMTVGAGSSGGEGGGGGYSVPIETSGLQVFWDASQYGGSGTTLSDLSGNGNDGTIRNAPTYVSDGDASYFDIQNVGTMGQNNSQGIFASDINYFNLPSSTAFSIGIWINATASDTMYPANLRAHANDATHEILLLSNNTAFGRVRRGGSSGDSSNSTIGGYPASNYSNNWTSMTLVADQSSSTVSFYTNGSLVNSESITVTMDSTQSTEFAIGFLNYMYGTVNGGSFGLVGKWNNASLYNRALTASEVLSNYNALSSRF